jgi:hypothetical protein
MEIMTRVDELMFLLNVDEMTARFYEAIESGQTAGDCIVIDDNGQEVKPQSDAK